MAESEEDLQSLLVKEESEKGGLKLSIHKMKVMASSPIISWQIDGENVETVIDFIFLGSKICADCDTAMKLKDFKLERLSSLFLGRKVRTNLDRILKSRDITLPTRSI